MCEGREALSLTPRERRHEHLARMLDPQVGAP